MAWHDTATGDCSVDTNKASASSILFAKNSAETVRQWEVVETTEVRALTEDAGQGKVPDTENEVKSDDATTQATYWANIDGTTYSITVTTGTKTEYGAARRDESGQWVCTKTKHTYFATGLTSKWGTTELDENGSAVTLGSGVEQTTSVSRTVTLVRQYNADGKAHTVSSATTTTVKEWKYISTEGKAMEYLSGLSQSISYNTYTLTQYAYQLDSALPQFILYATVPEGSESFGEVHYVSKSRGWTATVTTKEYSAIRTNGWITGSVGLKS